MSTPGNSRQQNAWIVLRSRKGFCSLLESIKSDWYLARSSRAILREMQEPNVVTEINTSQNAFVARMIEFDKIECLIARLARMTTDSHPKSASLKNVRLALQDEYLITELRENTSSFNPATTTTWVGSPPPEWAVNGIIRHSKEENRCCVKELQQNFDQELIVFNERIAKLLPSDDSAYWLHSQLRQLENARNKSVARKDLSSDGGITKHYQIGDFQIHWEALDCMLDAIQMIIESLEYMCHGCDGTHLVEYNTFVAREAKKFWGQFCR